jgi:spermidine/putrescine transport system substrate-binding protein
LCRFSVVKFIVEIFCKEAVMSHKPEPQDPKIARLVAQAKASQLTRRTFVAGAGSATLLAVLAACTPGGGGKSLTAAADVSASEKTLSWANWPYYIDQDEAGAYPTIDAFEELTGIAVTYEEAIPTNEEFYAKVKDGLLLGQDIGYDLVTLTDYFAARMVAQGLMQPIGLADMPNAKANLNPGLLDMTYDPGRQFSLPWQSGMTGLGWSTKAFPNGLSSLEELWDPALKGKIAVLDQWTDTMALILQSQGVDIDSNWGESEYGSAIEVLEKQVQDGQIRAFTGNDYTDLFKSGDIVAAVAWSGDIFIMNTEAGADDYGFAIPDQGGYLWSDNFMIPMGARHKANAQEMMDFYYQPEVAAEVAAYVNYITPVAGAQQAMEAIDPALAENPLIFPNADTLERAKAFRQITLEEDKSFSTQFEKAKVG